MKEPKDEKKGSILERLESLVSFSLKENIYELELEEKKGSRIRFSRRIPLPKQEEEVKKKSR